MAGKIKARAVAALKYAVALGLVVFVISKIDRVALTQAFLQTNLWGALVGFMLLHLAQVASAYRMRFYLAAGDASIGVIAAIRLYYLGMFYNTVLPSGVGGDGYKVYLLKRQVNLGVKQGVRVMLSERASGLLVLLWFLLGLLPLSPIFSIVSGGYILLGLAFIGVTVAYHVGVKMLCREHIRTSLGALPYSFAVQLLNLAVAAALFWSLGLESGWAGMLVLFNLASVLGAVLPVSIGGVGIRELTFLYGAPYMEVPAEQGVAFALLWYVVYVLVACLGLCFLPHSHRLLKGDSDGRDAHPEV